MSSQLIKQPNNLIFWVLLASGVAYVLSEQASEQPVGILSTISLTAFWCSAVAYISVRVYQIVVGRKKQRQDEHDENNSE